MADDIRRESSPQAPVRGDGGWDSWGMGPVHGATSRGRGWWQGEPLTAADVMNVHVPTVPRQMPITQIAELMRRESVGVVPVVDAHDCLVGVVTDRDIVVRGCVSARPLDELTAADVMSTDVECAKADDTLAHVVARMSQRHVRHLPVLHPGWKRGPRVAGLIAFDDLLAHVADDAALAEALKRRARGRHPGVRATGTERPSFLPALWRRLRG
jgi:CBS-domain-containing membrane protein